VVDLNKVIADVKEILKDIKNWIADENKFKSNL
jgi:hypothetical protein